jgi:S-formylglutathione hydrolase FrmB
MKCKHLVISFLMLAGGALSVSPAYASGYGPAPFYRPDVGAPSSERGISAQSIAADRSASSDSWRDVGGANNAQSQSGHYAGSPFDRSLFRHH